ncbi:MAG: pilus assembly protein PilM [Acidobacteria bacterium]|nr:pilus assembly protein PilM [Acidobacteriota bacterium]
MIHLDSSLGIEICGTSLVFTVVKRGVRRFRACRSRTIENFLQLDKAQLRDRVQQIRKQNGFNRDNVVLGLPRDQVILRQLELPAEAEENLPQLVKYQVEYYQPGEEANGSYFDYAVVGRDPANQKLTLLVALVRRDWLDPYLERLGANRIAPTRVEISPSAIFNLVCLKKGLLSGRGLVAVFDINDHAPEIVVLKGRQEVFSRALQIDPEGADMAAVLDPLQELLSEMKIRDGSIDRFYFSGTRAAPLFQAFKERFKETEWLSEAFKGSLQTAGHDNSVVSAGFALAPFCARRSPVSLNLLPPERRKTIRKIVYVPAALLALVLLAELLALGLHSYYQGRQFGASLDARIEALEPQVRDLRKIQTDIEKTRGDIDYLEEITHNRTVTLDGLKELTEKMPQEAYLQMLTIDTQSRSIDITGYSNNPTAIQNLLLRSSHFQKVENKYTTYDQRVKKDRFNFRAEIKP